MWNPPNPKIFNQTVWLIVRQIPEGCVSTYGQIASMIPPPPGSDPEQYRRLGARWVGSALRATPDKAIPWQRVINSQGKISFPVGSEGAEEQRRRLEAEGVVFDDRDRVDFAIYGWTGPDAAWLEEQDLFAPRPLT